MIRLNDPVSNIKKMIVYIYIDRNKCLIDRIKHSEDPLK